jgi:hypothetical protein
VSTGTAYAENQKSGSFQATTIIAPITRSIPKPFSMRVSKPPSVLGFRKVFILTRFVTVTRTCSQGPALRRSKW